ncbi:hypothetical protein IWQ51_005792 [Labrenzia sp. EL_142]|nr:hypothetical protein [Labrenzia sp. EL_142]
MSVQLTETEKRKLLIVERKLVRNHGHHHTQIAALKKLFPGFDYHLMTGEDYDGFLGPSDARISGRSRDLSKLKWRILHGTGRQKADAFLRAILAGRLLSLPNSPYGNELQEVCARLGFGRSDLILVPSADLETLESLSDLIAVRKADTPRLIARFLDVDLGEHKQARRQERLRKVFDVVSTHGGLSLFSETEEMAAEMKRRYGLDVRGEFYLPCSFDPGDQVPSPERPGDAPFRVGLFGGARPGKGYERISGIGSCLEKLIGVRRPSSPVEILLQGTERDYGPGGVYEFAGAYVEAGGPLRVVRLMDKLSPEEFRDRFLSVDAILLPYDTKFYGLQGSGIIQDAVATRKSIIHSKGIAMQSFLSHGNAISAVSDEEFAQAIVNMVQNTGEYEAGCCLAARYFERLLDRSPVVTRN